MFPIIWPLAAILYFCNRNDRYIKWISLFLFIGGGGSYFALMHSFIKPYLHSQGILSALEFDILSFSVVVFMSMFYFLLPYVFLMSSLAVVQKETLFLRIVLLIPSIILFMMEFGAISHGVNLNRLHIWAGLYIIISCFFYVMSVFKAGPKAAKRNYLRLTIIFIPILLLIYIKDYLFINRIILSESGIIFDQKVSWTVNSNFIDLWLIALLFFYSIRHGILGIKLRIEKQKLDASMATLSFGTSIINHTIKNEVQKIDYMLERAKVHLLQNDQTETVQSLEKIGYITEHLQQMANTLKENSEDMELSEREVVLCDELEKVLNVLEPILDIKRITLVRNYEYEGRLICDQHRVSEVFSNLCMNAIEAIHHKKGMLTISIKQVKRLFKRLGEHKIIMLTSLSEKEVVLQAFKQGAVNYITKSSYKDIISSIREAFQNRASIHSDAANIMRTEFVLSDLSPSEREIYELRQQGYNKTQISEKLFKSINTIKTQLRSIRDKLM